MKKQPMGRFELKLRIKSTNKEQEKNFSVVVCGKGEAGHSGEAEGEEEGEGMERRRSTAAATMAGEMANVRWLAGGDAISDESRVTVAGAELVPPPEDEEDEEDEEGGEDGEKEEEERAAEVAVVVVEGRLDLPWPVLL